LRAGVKDVQTLLGGWSQWVAGGNKVVSGHQP
jgi:3-mercaptopyruvate sulfurtransferase SseA